MRPRVDCPLCALASVTHDPGAPCPREGCTGSLQAFGEVGGFSYRPRKVKPGRAFRICEAPRDSVRRLEFDARGWPANPKRGSLTLFSGEPGCGKTTLLLASCSSVVDYGGRAVYITSEESVGTIADKAGHCNPEVMIAEAKSLGDVLRVLRRERPDFFVVDSLNPLSLTENVGRESVENIYTLIDWTRKRRSVAALVGHVNREGDVSGPVEVEHLVDAVVFIDLDKKRVRRIVGRKCRYGPDGPCGRYTLGPSGLEWEEHGLHIRIPLPSRHRSHGLLDRG